MGTQYQNAPNRMPASPTINEKYCPICGNPNRCGEKKRINGIQLSRCWCAYETFPKNIFQKIPKETYGKVCICQKCLEPFKSKNADIQKLHKILTELVSTWQNDPTISWTQFYSMGEKLLAWKSQENIEGLWSNPPKMITATIDDGIGQGLKMIHLFSRVAGISLIQLGLLQSMDTIINVCKKEQPRFLGLTILQFDTEEILNDLISQIPDTIQVLVGGPIFNKIPESALENKKYIPFNNVCDYLNFLLHYT
jgi:methylmalonyl-CoA mutase cobalamin-binding subunit